MKTEFEEMYSLVMHSGKYKDIMLYFEDTHGLRSLPAANIINKYENLLQSIKLGADDKLYEVEIPTHRVRAIVADGELVFDRRDSYQGDKDMTIPGFD